MIIKRAEISHLEKIMDMYDSCVAGMIKKNIDQWDETYPNKEVIKEDVKRKTYFIAIIDQEIIGGINIDQEQDPTYLTINWEDKTASFLVVHRLGVKEEFWNKKIGKKLMRFAEDLVVEKNLKSIRLDTYSNNPQAINFYKKLGYKQLGSINLKPNKKHYYCFEKLLI